MGTFQVAVQVGNLAGDRFELIEALVDTGASHSVFPVGFLRDLGVIPDQTMPFRLADERTREFRVGTAQLRLYDQTRYTCVVFGDAGMPALLGTITLEELGLGVDPLGRRLIQVQGVLYNSI